MVDFSAEARAVIHQAVKEHVLTQHAEEVSSREEADFDRDGYSKAYAILSLAGPRYLIGSARCRMFDFDAGISPRELAHDLAVVDAVEKLKAYCLGTHRPTGPDGLTTLRKATKGWLREGQLIPDIPSQCYQANLGRFRCSVACLVAGPCVVYFRSPRRAVLLNDRSSTVMLRL